MGVESGDGWCLKGEGLGGGGLFFIGKGGLDVCVCVCVYIALLYFEPSLGVMDGCMYVCMYV